MGRAPSRRGAAAWDALLPCRSARRAWPLTHRHRPARRSTVATARAAFPVSSPNAQRQRREPGLAPHLPLFEPAPYIEIQPDPRTMIFITPPDRLFATSVSRLVYCNPFLPERIACERAALGEAFVGGDPVWNAAARPLAAHAQRRAHRPAGGRGGPGVARAAGGRGGRGGVGRGRAALRGTRPVRPLRRLPRRARPARGGRSRRGGRRGARPLDRAPPSPRKFAHFEAFREQFDFFLRVPGLRCSRRRSRPTCWRSTSRSAGRSTSSSATSSARRWRRPGCGRRRGTQSSRTTCRATCAPCTTGWATSRRSSPGRPAPARNSSPARSGSRGTCRSTRRRARSPTTWRRRSTR